MKSSDEIRLVLSKRQIKALLFVALVMGGAYALKSESLTLSTYYPAPSGIYSKMITTNATYLARDGGNVGIGTTSPSAALEVNGFLRLSGASPAFRMTNVAEPVDDSDVATKHYVDALGGGGGSSFVGTTASVSSINGTFTYNNGICQASFSNSHWCSFSEIVKSGYTGSGSGWVFCDTCGLSYNCGAVSGNGERISVTSGVFHTSSCAGTVSPLLCCR